MKSPEQRRKAVEATLRWRARHPERAKAVQKAANAKYRERHPELCAANDRRKRAKKPELYAALDRAKVARKPALYAAIRAATVRRYQASKLKRTPVWADHEKIAEWYEAAQFAREWLGGEWHVDHIVPLQGRLASGLHVHNNLQILPGKENRRKAARFQVEFQG